MRANHSFRLDVESEEIVVEKIYLADNFLTRLKGLMFTSKLSKNEGLLIARCQQIHTHFMQYSLDVVFLDNSFQVIEVIRDLKPWRFTKFYKDAYYVLEMSAKSLPTSIKSNSKLALVTR